MYARLQAATSAAMLLTSDINKVSSVLAGSSLHQECDFSPDEGVRKILRSSCLKNRHRI